MKLPLSFFTVLPLIAFAAACSATTDDASEEPTSEIQDQELRKSITSCNADSDCVAVPRGGCCDNGWMEAVNKHHTRAYANATKCTLNPRPMCPMYMVHDTRIATCDESAHQCKMVANPAAALEGDWGADQSTMSITDGKASLEFGCGWASIDSFTFSTATNFTGTGTYTQGSGVQPPPGSGFSAVPATFKGKVSGNTLTLTMKVGSNSSTYVFTKNRQVMLMRCA